MFSCNKSWPSDEFWEKLTPVNVAMIAIMIGCAGVIFLPLLLVTAAYEAASRRRQKSLKESTAHAL